MSDDNRATIKMSLDQIQEVIDQQEKTIKYLRDRLAETEMHLMHADAIMERVGLTTNNNMTEADADAIAEFIQSRQMSYPRNLPFRSDIYRQWLEGKQ
jgi:molecular chaperone GrpE (heat shock protein)